LLNQASNSQAAIDEDFFAGQSGSPITSAQNIDFNHKQSTSPMMISRDTRF